MVLPTGTTERPFAGNLWTYQRLNGENGEESGLNGAESAHTTGPVDEDVMIFILADHNYDGIRFTFNVLTEDLAGLQLPVYFWNTSEWGVCVGCGRGHQERGVDCWKVYPGGRLEEVEDETECSLLERPTSERECRMEKCRYQWMASEWDPCNASCGVGIIVRTVWCESGDVGAVSGDRGGVSGDIRGETVEEELCPEESRPSLVQECHQEACQYQWRHREWGACDAVCGEGRKEREVWCEKEGRPGDVVREELCEGKDKPARRGSCHAPQSCSSFHWSVSSWSEVRVTWGKG